MRTLTKLLLVLTLMILPCIQCEAATKKTWVNVSTEFETDYLKDFTTAEGMCVDPKDNAIYTIQKDPDGNCALFKNGELVKKAFKNKDTTKLIGHGNDITYYNKHLYIADYDEAKVHRMKKKSSAYVYEKSYELNGYDKCFGRSYKKIWNIATYKRAIINGSEKQLFILGIGPTSDRKRFDFVIAYFENKTDNFHVVGRFSVYNPNSNPQSKQQPNVLQGITYNKETGWLHIGFSAKKDGDVPCLKNNIISIKVTHVTGLKNYRKDDQVIRTYNSPNGKNFEIESIGIDSNGKFYSLVNCKGCKDPVYYIKTK